MAPILGPPFCRPRTSEGITVERCHTIGSITPGSDPVLYLEAAIDLFSRCRNAFPECPMIVNTAGWVQDLGLEILVDLITKLGAAEIIYMSETGPDDTVQVLSAACTSARLTLLPSQESDPSARTAAQFRSMRTMSYFHSVAEDPTVVGSAPRWDATPIDHVPPYYVAYDGPSREITGVVRYGNQVAPQHLAKVINGMVLALVEVEDAAAFRIEQSEQERPAKELSDLLSSITETTPEGIPYITVPGRFSLDPRYSKALGLVLIRGIDTRRCLFHILTPINPDVLKTGRPKVMVSGTPGFGLPPWAYTESLEKQDFEAAGPDAIGETETDTDDPTPSTRNTGVRLLSGLDALDMEDIPYVEVLQGDDQRDTGQTLRIRRDLGRSG